MFCIKCGKQLPGESLFCPWCGSKVKLITEEQPNTDYNPADNDDKFNSVTEKIASKNNSSPPTSADIENNATQTSHTSNNKILNNGICRFLLYLLACLVIPVLILAILHPVDEKFIVYITSVKGYGRSIASSLGGTIASYILFLPLVVSIKGKISCKIDLLEIIFVVLLFIHILDTSILEGSFIHSSLFLGITAFSFVAGIVLLIYNYFVKDD